MAMPTQTDTAESVSATARTGVGRPGRVAVSWSMAGGILAVLPVAVIDSVSAHALIPITAGLFVFGAVIGFVFGAVVGACGRMEGRSGGDVVRSVCLGVLIAVPCLAAAALAAFWISMTVVAAYLDALATYAGVATGWLAGAIVIAWAVIEGLIAVRAALGRWASWVTVGARGEA